MSRSPIIIKMEARNWAKEAQAIDNEISNAEDRLESITWELSMKMSRAAYGLTIEALDEMAKLRETQKAIQNELSDAKARALAHSLK